MTEQCLEVPISEGEAETALLQYFNECPIVLPVDLTEVDAGKVGRTPSRTSEGPFVLLSPGPVAIVALHPPLGVHRPRSWRIPLSSTACVRFTEWCTRVSAKPTVCEWLHGGQLAKVSSDDELKVSPRDITIIHLPYVPNTRFHPGEEVVLDHADLVDDQNIRLPNSGGRLVLGVAALSAFLHAPLQALQTPGVTLWLPAHITVYGHTADVQSSNTSRCEDIDLPALGFELTNSDFEDG